MTTTIVSQTGRLDLPQALRIAQEAIHFPEVQDMLRKLAEYKLGIFMPHMHDEKTGEFQQLPDKVTQVESGLAVSFESAEKIANQSDRFLPVGWVWQGSASTPSSVCEMISEEGQEITRRYTKHKMAG